MMNLRQTSEIARATGDKLTHIDFRTVDDVSIGH